MSQKQEQSFYHLRNKFDTIVCIGRGGMLPSLLLSHTLDIKDVQILNLSSYSNRINEKINKHNKTELDIKGKRVLIVDDLVDTGATLKKALEYCSEAKTIKTFTVHYKKRSKIQPDYFFKIINSEWINYDYETNQDFEKWFKD